MKRNPFEALYLVGCALAIAAVYYLANVPVPSWAS